jgi:PAN domain-containing protein
VDLKAAARMRFLLRSFLGLSLAAAAWAPATAQKGFDRPGGDYLRFVVPSGDPAVCQARCDRDARCRAWVFSYPRTAGQGGANAATCWLKNQVKPLIENRCCVAGVKGGALGENRPGPIENAIDRVGGDYRHFDIPTNPDVEMCKKACEDENRCRAWTYVRPGYLGVTARCYLKDKIKPPRRKPCCMSGVVR